MSNAHPSSVRGSDGVFSVHVRPSRRQLSALVVAAALGVAWLAPTAPTHEATVAQPVARTDEPTVTPSPGPLSAEMRARLDALVVELAAKRTTTNDVLADPAWGEFRPYTEFRDAIEQHAAVGRATLVPRGEPGEPLLVRGRVVDGQRAPCANVLLYAYHTSAKGWYAAEAPHVSGNAGDSGHARLFAYCRTDADGRFELTTVRPGGYPRSTSPQHIHVHLQLGAARAVGEILFADDPRLTAEARKQHERAGDPVATVEKRADGTSTCSVEFVLEREG